MKLVVLISGSGSNLQAIIDQIHSEPNGNIELVISNKPNVGGLIRAQNANIPTSVIDHTSYQNKQAFEREIINQITTADPDLIILAGFMRILSDDFIAQFPDKIINIHPSLLPKFKGLNTHQRAIEAGESTHGATVHLVIPELDSGPIIEQASIDILKTDTPDSLAEKVLAEEHKLFPRVIKKLMNNELRIVDGEVIKNC